MAIIVTGYAATYPVGGATWDYLQYVLGLKRLVHRVYHLEETGRWSRIFPPRVRGTSWC